jgi:hypothetical protein
VNNLRRRIEKLERAIIGDEIRLVMGDGSVTTIQERWIPRIFREAMQGELSAETLAVVSCISTDEIGGMCDLVRAIYLSPQ